MGKDQIEQLLDEAESLATNAIESADEAKTNAKEAILKILDVKNELWLIVDKSETIAEKVSEVLFDKWGTVMQELKDINSVIDKTVSLHSLRAKIILFHNRFYKELGENGE